MKDKQETLIALKNGDEKVFKAIFLEWFQPLYVYAYRFVHDEQLAEEIVQDAFLKFWERRKKIDITDSIKSYLYTTVKNLSLNHLKSNYASQKNTTLQIDEIEEIPSNELNTTDKDHLVSLLNQGIQSLPERCKVIFLMSRSHGLTYEEIAQELSISKETVKSQIKIAFKKLQQFILQHPELVLILFFLKKFYLLFPLSIFLLV